MVKRACRFAGAHSDTAPVERGLLGRFQLRIGGSVGSSLVLEPADDEAVPHTRDRAPRCLVPGQCLNTRGLLVDESFVHRAVAAVMYVSPFVLSP